MVRCSKDRGEVQQRSCWGAAKIVVRCSRIVVRCSEESGGMQQRLCKDCDEVVNIVENAASIYSVERYAI